MSGNRAVVRASSDKVYLRFKALSCRFEKGELGFSLNRSAKIKRLIPYNLTLNVCGLSNFGWGVFDQANEIALHFDQVKSTVLGRCCRRFTDESPVVTTIRRFGQ